MYVEVIDPDNPAYGKFFEIKRNYSYDDYDRLVYGIYRIMDRGSYDAVFRRNQIEVVQEKYTKYKTAS